MTTHEAEVISAAPIPRSSLVAGAGSGQHELTRDLRAVAMQAACEWTRRNEGGDPSAFGQQAARVYLAALRELEAGFEPELKRDWER